MAGSRHKQSITYLPLLIMAAISSLKTSSGRCGLRSDSTRAFLWREGGPSPVSHGPLLTPCPESAPCPHVCKTPASGHSNFKVLHDKEVACPLRSLLWRGENGEREGRGGLLFSSHPEAVPLTGSLWFVDFFNNDKWGSLHPAAPKSFRTWAAASPRALALTFMGP